MVMQVLDDLLAAEIPALADAANPVRRAVAERLGEGNGETRPFYDVFAEARQSVDGPADAVEVRPERADTLGPVGRAIGGVVALNGGMDGADVPEREEPPVETRWGGLTERFRPEAFGGELPRAGARPVAGMASPRRTGLNWDVRDRNGSGKKIGLNW